MGSLLACLFVLFNQVALSQLQEDCGDSALESAVLQLHNEIREGVARRSFEHESGEIKYNKVGSKNMFALSYDCSLQGLAYASVVNCRCDKMAILSGKATKANIQKAYETTIELWRDDAKDEIPLPLSAATYTSNIPENFANLIYYKSLKMGCAHQLCSGEKRAQIACVYSKRPQSGKPLYIEASTKSGCTTKKCKELVSEAKCNGTCGLCMTDNESIDESTTTSAAAVTSSLASEPVASSTPSQESTSISSQASSSSASDQTSSPRTSAKTTSPSTPSQTTSRQTTPGRTTSRQTTPSQTTPRQTTTSKGSSGCMTDDIRNQVVNAINEKRASLAKGQVQNGPTAAGKGKLPSATNMYKMSYDTALEDEAQTYTNTFPPKPGKSDLSTRIGHGETTRILDDKSLSCEDALKNAMDAWWNEITGKALNSAVKYTQVLEQSANAPTNFTQMAWAASYKVGCGVNQCDYGTIVVCRYYVRGNIYSQYIYRIGTNCASCSSTCTNGLCKAPN